MEPKILYRAAVEQVPVDAYYLPLDKAEVLKPGKDLTIISYGTPLYTCSAAITAAEKDFGCSVELIDLRTIYPWDRETVLNSVKKTGRAVVVHESMMNAGVGAEVAATIQERAFLRLEAPVKRVAGWATHTGLMYEQFIIPDVTRKSLVNRGTDGTSTNKHRGIRRYTANNRLLNEKTHSNILLFQYYTPPPHPNTPATIPPNTASHPNALTAYPPPIKPPTTASFLPLMQFATTNPLEMYMHLVTSAGRSLMNPVCGSNKMRRDARTRGMKVGCEDREGRERRVAFRSMLGMWREAIGLRVEVSLDEDPFGVVWLEDGLAAVDVVGGGVWRSGADRWRRIMKSVDTNEMGRIWLSRMYVRIVLSSKFRWTTNTWSVSPLPNPVNTTRKTPSNIPFSPTHTFQNHVPSTAPCIPTALPPSLTNSLAKSRNNVESNIHSPSFPPVTPPTLSPLHPT